MAQSGSNKKVANSLVALSSAAVLAVYAAGYTRTRSAANRFEAESAERRPSVSRAAPDPPAAEPSPAVPATPLPASADRKSGVMASEVSVPATARVPAPAAAPSPTGTPAPSSTDAPATAPVAGQAAEPAAPAVDPKPEAASAVPPAPAPAAAPAPTVPPAAPPVPVWKDGTYLGWGSSRHGDIQASVVIEGGRIASATIAQCLTRYSCAVIDRLPPEVAQRQSPEVDYVSGATQSTNAFYYAVVDALGKAK